MGNFAIYSIIISYYFNGGNIVFIYNLEDVAKKLKIDFEGITKQIQHNGVKGSAREDLLKDYLKKLLPEKYSISSGIIIDNNQKQSKQQDFIIK